MAESIHRVVMEKTKEILEATRYVAVTCDEVTTVNCQSWISIHDYVVRD